MNVKYAIKRSNELRNELSTNRYPKALYRTKRNELDKCLECIRIYGYEGCTYGSNI